jgi:Flp pilus assembly protein TadD
MGDERIYLDAALGHFRDGEFDKAVHACRWGLTVYPDDGRLWEVRGLSHWMRGDLASALRALETASVLVPLDPLAQLALAAAYAWADKPDLARTVYRHLAGLPGFPVPLLPRLAAGLGRVGEYAAALLVCEEIVEVRPDYHPAWFGIAFYRRKLGRSVGDAIAPLARAATLAPDEDVYRLNLAGCHAQAGDFPAAYRVAATVDVASIRCPNWLRLMLPVFDAAGDAGRRDACRRQLDGSGDAHGGECSSRP